MSQEAEQFYKSEVARLESKHKQDLVAKTNEVRLLADKKLKETL